MIYTRETISLTTASRFPKHTQNILQMPRTNSQTETSGWWPDWFPLTIVLGLILLLYYLVPIVSLLGAQTPATIFASLQSARMQSAATTSVIASVASTSIAAILGLPLAY